MKKSVYHILGILIVVFITLFVHIISLQMGIAFTFFEWALMTFIIAIGLIISGFIRFYFSDFIGGTLITALEYPLKKLFLPNTKWSDTRKANISYIFYWGLFQFLAGVYFLIESIIFLIIALIL